MTKNKWIADLEWVNPAKQERSERMIDALLDAAERLVAEKGTDATSIADIASLAQCSVGAVYHHFKDKNELQRALFNRMTKRMQATSETALDPARWEGATVLDIFRGYLEFSLEVARENPGHKQAVHEIANNDASMQALLKKLEAEMYSKLRQLLMLRKNEVRHPDADFAIRFSIDQCSAIIRMRREKNLLAAQTATRSDAKIVEQTIKSIAAYLEIS